jgi:hypothetical protein
MNAGHKKSEFSIILLRGMEIISSTKPTIVASVKPFSVARGEVRETHLLHKKTPLDSFSL